jgi:hypothetical protein
MKVSGGCVRETLIENILNIVLVTQVLLWSVFDSSDGS